MTRREKLTAQELEKAWKAEIARRVRDLDSGKAKAISWEEVRRRISAKSMLYNLLKHR